MTEVTTPPKDPNRRQRIATYILLGFSVVFFFTSFLFLASERARNKLREVTGPADRVILSVASADLIGGGNVYRVLKILSPEGIFVEVYGPDKNPQNRSLVDSFRLPDKKDGYFHIGGQATNLALKDLDNDGHPEIIAPTYDLELKPHLNALKLNPETNKLEAYTGNVP